MVSLKPIRIKILDNFSMLAWGDEIPPELHWLSPQDAVDWFHGQGELLEQELRRRIRDKEEKPKLLLPGRDF